MDAIVESRFVEEFNLTVCANGHVVDAVPTGRTVKQIKHTCGQWTWADGNYCCECGELLRKE